MSSVRSGSTLLRSLLNAHSQLHAPHELHVRRLRVHATTDLAARAMELLGHNEADLEHLLWDRVMHRELALSGKEQFVDKTPANAFAFRRIATCWPEARYVFLLRHPASIAASWARATRHKWTREEATLDSLRYMRALDRAWRKLDGLTVRYEDLTSEPAAVTQRICAFLDVDWEDRMLDYGRAGDSGDSPTFVKGTGDWGATIRSGQVQPARALPADADVPEVLRPISRRWGYLETSDPS
jgi:LPS sulfotransferase NodH